MQKLTNTLVDNTNPLHKMYNLYMFFIHLLLDFETNRLWNVRVATVTSAQLSTGTPMSENSSKKAREQETREQEQHLFRSTTIKKCRN